MALREDNFEESVTKAPLQWQGEPRSRREQAAILPFPAALPPLLTGTLYTTGFSNSYLISLFLKWSRFKPSLFGRFTEESVHCTWKAKQLGLHKPRAAALLLRVSATEMKRKIFTALVVLIPYPTILKCESGPSSVSCATLLAKETEEIP